MNNLSQFSLRWNNYVQHVTEAFQALRTQDDLVDVTLCCEGQKIKAHKLLLSACSVYFREIFKDNPCKHPIVIFRNVKFEDLNAIVNFMYHGEVNIVQEQLESFLITAELLEVNGLTDGSEEDDKEKGVNPLSSPGQPFVRTNTGISGRDEMEIKIDEPINLATTQVIKQTEYNSAHTSNANDTLNVQYNNIVTTREELIRQDAQSVPSSITVTPISEDNMHVDTSNDTNDDFSDRINTNEGELAKFKCQLCPKGFKHPTSLTLHKDSHTGKTQCPVCRRSFSRSYDMRSHLQKIHRGNHLTIKEIRYKIGNDNASPKTYTHYL